MAYSTVVVLPIVIVFICLQKYIVSGLTAGSVKGERSKRWRKALENHARSIRRKHSP